MTKAVDSRSFDDLPRAEMKLISVIIPTLNRAELLGEALESVVNQTFDDVEVIVVNDGGRTLAPLLEEWQRKLRLRLIELTRTSGVSRARNLGVQHAGGQYIAFLDDDDVFLPHHLQTAQDALATTGSDLVYLGALVSDRRLRSLPADYSGMYRKSYHFDDKFLLVANYIHTGSVVVRSFRETRLRFDEALTLCEDWDLWIALRSRLGYRFTFVDELTSIYHQLPGTGGMVAEGQAVSPSPFSVVRDYIYAKWPSGDLRVESYRAWFTRFESYRNARITAGHPMPPHLFDGVLQSLYTSFTRGHPADILAIPAFFEV